MRNEKLVAPVVVLTLIFIGGLMFGLPQYRVWQRTLSGQAELREAEYTRQVAVEEARAELDSSKLLREAEVERAKGAAEAMAIIKEGIDSAYLEYLAIQAQTKMADSPNHTTVYIPSGEQGIPLIREVEK